jgi:hypothetical protein
LYVDLIFISFYTNYGPFTEKRDKLRPKSEPSLVAIRNFVILGILPR